MQKHIDDLRGHIVVCGAGRTGFQVIEELAGSRETFVVVDTDRELLESIDEKWGTLSCATWSETPPTTKSSSGPALKGPEA